MNRDDLEAAAEQEAQYRSGVLEEAHEARAAAGDPDRGSW